MLFCKSGVNSNLEKGLLLAQKITYKFSTSYHSLYFQFGNTCVTGYSLGFSKFMMDLCTSAPEVLDLCVRKRPQPPDAFTPNKRPTIYVDSATCQFSPVSNSDSESYPEVSSNTVDMNKSPSQCATKTKGGCRPFKAYIKDPFTLAQGLVSTEMLLQKDSSEAFSEFRNKILAQVQNNNNNGTNKNMRRLSQSGNNKNEDPTYWEKRRKNNEAAKRSRDARRAKEDEMAIRCAFLERENCHLKYLTESLKKELEKLQQMIYLRDYRAV